MSENPYMGTPVAPFLTDRTESTTRPYAQSIFPTLLEAIEFQRQELLACIKRGEAVRSTGIESERDHATGLTHHLAWVRPFRMVVADNNLSSTATGGW